MPETKSLDKTAYYKLLSRRVVVTVIVVSLTPLGLVAAIILEQFRFSYREKTYAHLTELVEKHQQNIDTFLNEKLDDIRFLAASDPVAQLQDEAFLQSRLMLLREKFGHVFEDIGMIDDRGVQVAYAGPYKLLKAQYNESEWFRKAQETTYFISDVFLGLRGLPHFIVSVQCPEAGRLWILRATIDFLAFNSLVENLRIGQTGFAYIINGQGRLQTRSKLGTTGERKQAPESFVTKFKQPETGVRVFEHQNASGVQSLYATAFLKHNQWLLVCQQPSKEAFSDFSRARGTAVLIFLAGGLGIIIMAFVLSHRMVNRIARSDREMERMNQQIIEMGKLAAIGELAAGIAHEINNPVAIMVEEAGWIQDLLEEEDLHRAKNIDEFHRALNQIRAQGRRCKDITQKLLSFARKTDATIHSLDINTTAQEIIAVSTQRAKYAQVIIQTHFSPDLPKIQASPTEMQQVLLNVVNNALDAMEKSGGTLSLSTRKQDSAILIEIADTGAGIPPADLARIFEPFFTTKPVGKGTGLGLSICYGIIKKMGGEIEVKSTVGAGTTFTIRMPIASA
jgi:two-component system NtrC family sensor kinase